MLIDRWDRCHDLGSLRNEMSRFATGATPRRRQVIAQRTPQGREPWAPATDIWDAGDEVGLRLELPGIEKDDIDVSVEDGVLTVSGEKRDPGKSEGERSYRRVESSFGAFARKFVLPENLDPSKVEASYANGVLTLSIQRREESLPKKVDVTIH